VKFSDVKFHENPSSGSRDVPCRQRDRRTDGQTDMSKLVAAFRNFGITPNNSVTHFVFITKVQCLILSRVITADCGPR